MTTTNDRPPFTLTCRYCDAGMEIHTPEQALAAGWIEIEPAFQLIEANDLGTCLECPSEASS